MLVKHKFLSKNIGLEEQNRKKNYRPRRSYILNHCLASVTDLDKDTTLRMSKGSKYLPSGDMLAGFPLCLIKKQVSQIILRLRYQPLSCHHIFKSEHKRNLP